MLIKSVFGLFVTSLIVGTMYSEFTYNSHCSRRTEDIIKNAEILANKSDEAYFIEGNKVKSSEYIEQSISELKHVYYHHNDDLTDEQKRELMNSIGNLKTINNVRNNI